MLLSLLQVRRDWPGTLLAERLEVSPRTVRRDVDRLRELGYPIVTTKGPDGGYRLGAGSALPPLLFDDEQAVALTLALQIATTAGAGLEEPAVRALNTIRQVLPARLRHRIDALRITAVETPSSRPVPDVDTVVLTTLGAAVHHSEVLRFDYAADGMVEALGPDRCRVAAGSWSWVGLAGALGRFDADIEVVGPPELTAAFARLARRYADAADSGPGICSAPA